MAYLGEYYGYYAEILFMLFAVIAVVLFFIQIICLQKLNIFPVYCLPCICFCVAFENILLYLGEKIDPNSDVANAGYFFYSLIIPLLLVSTHELAFKLHEARAATFFFVSFDQGENMTYYPAIILFWAIRIIAFGLFIMNIFVSFGKIPNYHPYTGRGGYAFLAENSESDSVWLSLIPAITLSFIGILIGIVLYRYGRNWTLSLSDGRKWRIILVGALCQAVGQCFGLKVYAVTSNAGELALLIGLTVCLKLVQNDLTLAGSFADFLHESNIVFAHPSTAPLSGPVDVTNNRYNRQRIQQAAGDSNRPSLGAGDGGIELSITEHESVSVI